jgi:hypothetical protein
MGGNVSRLGNIFEDVAVKAPCRAATTGTITLSGLQTVDGVALAEGDRVLVYQQADETTNGIYQASSGNWLRTYDASKNTDFVKGTSVGITDGTVNAGQLFWVTCSDSPIVLGTSELTWMSRADILVLRPEWIGTSLTFLDINGNQLVPPVNLVGAVGPNGSSMNFATRAQAIATAISPALSWINVGAETTGGPLYMARYVQGAGPRQFTDAGGTTWHLDLSRNTVDLRWFGGAGDGVTDNTAAWTAAIAALPAQGGTIEFGPGKWRFNSPVACGGALAATGSISIIGQGQDETVLYFPNGGGGISVALSHPSQSIHARDFTITTGVANGSTAINVSQAVPLGAFAQSTFTDITFRGDDNYATFYWTTNLALTGVSGVNVRGCLFWGPSANNASIGIALQGNLSVSPFYQIVINVDQCGFFGTIYGIEYGSYVQGVTVEQCNFTNGEIGIYIPAGATGVLAQLNVTDSQFNTTLDQISMNSELVGGFFGQNLFFCPAGHSGIAAGTSTQCCAQSNQFVNAVVGNGIGITADGPFWTITGNQSNSMATGVSLQAGASFCVVTGNLFQACSVGLVIASAGVQVTGNFFNANALAINVTHTPSLAAVNIQSNSYQNNTANTNPASTTGTVTIGGGSA